VCLAPNKIAWLEQPDLFRPLGQPGLSVNIGTEFNMRRALFILSVVILSGFLGIPARGQASNTNAQLALLGGTIYTSPSEEPIRDGAILIDGGKIVAVGRRASVRVPRGTNVIDATGSTITAGLWNSHVHFLERMWADAATLPAADLTRQFQMMLTQYGFTSVFDIWSSLENTRQLRDRVESGQVAGPRIRFTGPAMFPRVPDRPHRWIFPRRRPGPVLVSCPGENPELARRGGVRGGRGREEAA